MYTKNSIACRQLPKLHFEEHEVLWSLIRTRRLPRGFSSVITGVANHPPDADSQSMRDYIRESLIKIESRFPNRVIIIACDFNKLDLETTLRSFQLKHWLVNGLSDHLTLIMNPRFRQKQCKGKR